MFGRDNGVYLIRNVDLTARTHTQLLHAYIRPTRMVQHGLTRHLRAQHWIVVSAVVSFPVVIPQSGVNTAASGMCNGRPASRNGVFLWIRFANFQLQFFHLAFKFCYCVVYFADWLLPGKILFYM